MAKLVVSFRNEVKGHYFLDKDRFAIGRHEDNDILLTDPSVSKFHAVILTIGNDQVLEDANSSNGVQVNGQKISKHILQNNDVVQLGDFQLKYINQRAPSNMDFDKTMFLKAVPLPENQSADAKPTVTEPAVSASLSAARSVNVSLPLGGVREADTKHEILIQRPLKTFGHSGKQIAMISRRPLGYYVTHVAGKKPTRLNGKKIGTQPCLLKENDFIEVADKKLVFFIKQ